MTDTARTDPRRGLLPRRLLLGASMAALSSGLAMPAQAQLARLRAAAGTSSPVPSTSAPIIPVRPVTMREALTRSQSLQTRADQIRGYVTAARDAALTANRATPTEGLSANGLDPIAAVKEAAALTATGGVDNIARAQALLASVSATGDATGLNTWEGAGAPVQTSAGGKTNVSVTQNQSRALLTWNRFDIGANTTLQFVQQQGGVAQTGWTVVNRVAQGTAPSTILGSVKADGTVLVLNRNGVIFGKGAQVNLASLLASTLEIGNFGRDFRDVIVQGKSVNVFDAITLKERNTEYLQNGLFAGTQIGILPSLLLAPLYDAGTYRTDATPTIEGAVTVDAGASITAASAGFVILAGPSVTNGGTISASEGQVSLQGGRLIAATRSTGASNSADVNVRGLILRTIGTAIDGNQRRSSAAAPLDPIADDGVVTNTGLIESPRGYLSLGAGLFGTVTNAGLLTSTTSVSRNGKIALNAGFIDLAGSSDASHASGIVITPDKGIETIPQGTAAAPPAFKTSQIEIGARADDPTASTSGTGLFIPAVVSIGENALILAPSANVVVGRDASTAFDPTALINTLSSISIANGAAIDVSGVKDVQLDATRNSIAVTPVKRNELRDTPTYREVSLTGDFTLNGSTLFVDPRLSGVRADGVRWVGSPLIEAGSIASQLGVTAAELMTKGGNVSLGVNLLTAASPIASAPHITIAPGATIDFGGGWVHYNAGLVKTSNLLTADGRIVNIGDADPNDIFVAVADGYTQVQPKAGSSETFEDPLLSGNRYEAAYDEGRDAGSLVIGGSAISVAGSLYGEAFAGTRQIAGAVRPSVSATIAQDPRSLQGSAQDLPSGGFLRIGSLSGAAGVALGGDISVVPGATSNVATDGSTTLLSDAMLSRAGLSALSLQTSGGVSFASGSALSLADGGSLRVDAGRAITFAGSVRVASGSIAARTYELSRAPISAGSITALGSAFSDDDDISGLYAVGDALPHPFDITVTSTGRLSTAGRFVNDLIAGATGQPAQGSAFADGGSISLTVAPKVLVALGDSVATAEVAGDLSGRLTIASGALLDVSAGGYVAADRSLRLTASGGDISLINETTYASTVLTVEPVAETPGASNQPIGGSNQSVDFTPTETIVPALVPGDPQASVSFEQASLKGFGFSGGGTFTLVAPSISFGSDTTSGAAHIGLDFFRATGFGTLDATTFRSRIVPDIFTNARRGNSAFFETTSFQVRAGETFDLTQALLPQFLNRTQASQLLALASDDPTKAGNPLLTIFTPGVPAAAFDRVAANFRLGGLTEFDVLAGGTVTGAAQARITAPKILNAGTISLPGGSLVQRDVLPINIALSGLGVTSLTDVFGTPDASGRFDENAPNSAGVVDASGALLSIRDLFVRTQTNRFVYFTGLMSQGEGIRLTTGSVTDLSGTALVDTHAGYLPSGRQLLTGRIVTGGTISTAALFNPPTGDQTFALFSTPVYGNVRYFNASDNALPPIVGVTAPRVIDALPGATVDLSGASTLFDVQVSATAFAPSLQWSDGGTLSVGGGGSIAGAAIDAHGGAPQATGGTLRWARPTIRQENTEERTSGELAASQIEQAGFATLTAIGGVSFVGASSLTLSKAFTVESIASTTGAAIDPEAQVSVSAGADATASIIAPFIRFASRIGSVPNLGAATDTGGSLLFTASSGIDLVGGVLFDSSVKSVTLATPGDVRFIGVNDVANSTGIPSLNGRVIAWGDLTIDAGRSYATTGTGNLQRFIEDQRAGVATTASPFLVAALGESSITFGGTYLKPSTTAPLSAGSYLKIQAKEITQAGYLAAPLGRIEMGGNDAITFGSGGLEAAATTSLTFAPGSVTTVSGAGLNVPYGTTTDLTDYFFSPSVGLPITAVPTGQLSLAGRTIDVAAGAKVDGRGGGDVFAFEFVSGTGGSRDVLDRFNRDAFSANDYDPATGIGYQFADHRQVYAIVPADQARSIAPFDPIYSADYQTAAGTDLYGAQVGLSVTLDGGNGIPPGEYVLLPAHYALLPGAYRVVENVGVAAPVSGGAQTLLDGSVIVGGTFSTAGTSLAQSERRSFTIQSRDVFGSYSRLETTGGTAATIAQAAAAGLARPRVPLDAARVVLAPQTMLTVAGAFDTTPAEGGRGAQFDILAESILISATDAVAAPRRTLLLTDDTLARLNANSLSIGAARTENDDGTTDLGIVARSITIGKDVTLSAPELILSVGGAKSEINILTGATLTATGPLDDAATGDYVIRSLSSDDPGFGSNPYDKSGIGAVVRLSSGVERLITRQGDTALRNTLKPATLNIEAALLAGHAIAIDTSQQLILSDRASIVAPLIALGGDTLQFGGPGFGAPLLQKLAAADRLTLRSRGTIAFASGRYAFNDLRLDTPGIVLDAPATGGDVKISADVLTIGNTADDLGACTGTVCGDVTNSLTLLAREVDFVGGTTRTFGFGGGVVLGATQGMYVSGKGSLDTGATALALRTPFVFDRAIAADPRDQQVRPDFTFATTGAITLSAPSLAAGATAPTPTGNAAPGARIAFGTATSAAASVTFVGTDVRATSGIIDVESNGAIRLLNGASLSTPGYTRTFGDAVDSVTVVSGGGTVNLVSLAGDIAVASSSSLTVDTGVGAAGTLNLLASNGAITFGNFNAAFGATATKPRTASLSFDSGKSAFDLGGFAKRYAALFGGDLAIRSGAGDLALGTGQTLRASSVLLVADGGTVLVGGTIDTSGLSVAGLSPTDAADVRVNGGDVSLYGARGVTLGATALIDTHTSGYLATDTRSAQAGDVSIGVGDADAAITFAAGARIDAGARRTQEAVATGTTGARLVTQTVKDPFSLADTTVYRLVAADQGGTVSFRAPVIAGAQDTVDVRLGGTITGASDVQIEGYRRYDLDALAATGDYSGIHATASGVTLDFAESAAAGDPRNILTEVFGTGANDSLAKFIQTFSITAKDGSDLSGILLRPGVELVSAGDITLATNWNLAAGTLDETAALAAGVLTVLPELGKHADGTPYYAVTPGREAELLQDYVTMLYRVGGKATGEAGVVTMRARGSLDIGHSISDGFFSFGDLTDPKYMSYQLGGGNRTVAPAVKVTCGLKSSVGCGGIVSFDDVVGQDGVKPKRTITISLDNPVAGSDQNPGILAPYSAAANSAAALGSGKKGAGDPLAGADLFPLLEDGTRAVGSTSLRLVAGADAARSADPLHVDRATGADLVVHGEQSYTIAAKTGKATFGGTLELKLKQGPAATDGPVTATPEDFLDAASGSLSRKRAEGLYTVLNWGSDGKIAETTRERAMAYFAQNFPEAVFQGKSSNPSGVAAPLSAILGFLQAYGDEYASKVVAGTFPSEKPSAPKPLSPGRADTVYSATMIRTGDGSLDLVAARTVDLRRTVDVVYRNGINGTGNIPSSYGIDTATRYQVGGTAVYTAGHLVTRQPIVALAPDGSRVTYRWIAGLGSSSVDPEGYLPSFTGSYLNGPELIEGGGDVLIHATTGDVLARRDVWAEQFLTGNTIFSRRVAGTKLVTTTAPPAGLIGATDQRWRVGQTGEDTEAAVVAQLFTAGVGALGGGDVSIVAGGRVDDLTLALDTSITTADPFVPSGTATGLLTGTTATGVLAPATLATFGGGNAFVRAGGDLVGSQFDFASGEGSILVGGDVIGGGRISKPDTNVLDQFRLRVADAYVHMAVRGSVTLGGVGALGIATGNSLTQNAGLGFFSAAAGLDLVANEQVTLNASRPELNALNFSDLGVNSLGVVLPPTLQLASVTGDITFGNDIPRLLYPSNQGQLSLIAGGDIDSLALSMSDADPSLLPGAFSVRFANGGANGGLNFGFDGVSPSTGDRTLRLYHNERSTHADDDTPARVYAGGSVTNTTLSLAKQARIGAGLDIVDMVFTGQNVRDGDVTRITAGRDIIGTTDFSSELRLPYVRGNSFTLGGYGTLAIEAGRNLGPFLNSATLGSGAAAQSYAGGIRTVGNDLNPWLESRGASVQALFGIAHGANYDALQTTYLDPTQSAQLDGDLFVQISDANGNLSPDRTRPIYAPILADWLATNAPKALAEAFGGTLPTGTALEQQSYARFSELYAAFARLDNLTRRTFLINELYFNELAQSGIPTSPSAGQPIRGYRAAQTLFPPTLGYTDNLATYTTDPSSVTADHPLGVPRRALGADNQPIAATRVVTGNVDLRLAAIETARGGDVTLLGPGGDVLAGSVVRTSDQATRRATIFGSPPLTSVDNGFLGRLSQQRITSIPIGFEGVLTLRGGSIRSFTDGDFRLNQSRLFTLAGGDITMWSSNGDLNAGQGPRSASSFPPITVRFDQNGRAEVDSAGSVAGAGIGAFKQSPDDPDSSIILLAPVGTVDAGDAGVRASGNIFVFAAVVANADNFSTPGTLSGVPAGGVVAAPATPASAASSIVGNLNRLANAATNNADKLSLISVDVLGFFGSEPCDDPNASAKDCPPSR